jgi:hypothetical protein
MGILPEDWSDWFEGFDMRQEGENVMVFSGYVVDSSALYGIVGKLRDLNLELLSIRQLDP